MIGSDDQVVTGQKLLMDKCCHKDKELKEYPNGRHNLLQEPSLKQEVMQDIRRWILEHSTSSGQII
jgi:alpha-beta hydrolase superfamily lysophospholipase